MVTDAYPPAAMLMTWDEGAPAAASNSPAEAVVTWDESAPVIASDYSVITSFPWKWGFIESVTPYRPEVNMLVNGVPWRLGTSLKCGDVVSYKVDRPFSVPAAVMMLFRHGGAQCP